MFKFALIKKLREQRNLSPNDLSLELYKKSGVKISRNTLVNWEQGCHQPRANELFAIATYFRIPMDRMFKS